MNSVKTHSRLTTYLVVVFFFSGFASLIYQVIWQRLLTMNYGVGFISVTLIVSVYMLGLGVGALLGGYLSERVKDRFTLYLGVELLLGLFGLLSLPFLDFLSRKTAGSSYLISFGCMFLFLCIPTVLMGMTLPLVTKIFNSYKKNFLYTVSRLYFFNTLGAAVGAVCASYILISFFGLDIGIYAAVTINVSLGVFIFFMRRLETGPEEEIELKSLSSFRNEEKILGKIAYILVFITGFLAIGYEIIWIRIVEVLIKTSPYAFSTVLFVYLLGVALGSLGMNRYVQKHQNIEKKNLFFLLQVLIGFYVIVLFIGYFYLTKYTFLNIFTGLSFSSDLHPSFNILSPDSLKSILGGIYTTIDVVFWPFIFLFIPTVLMGASFPLISSLALSKKNKEGRTVGRVYFFNITGNVLGAILTGFLILPLIGTEITLILFSSIGILFGLFITGYSGKKWYLRHRIGAVFLILTATVILFPKDGQLYAVMHNSPGAGFSIYSEEGVDGIIITYQREKESGGIDRDRHRSLSSPVDYRYENVEMFNFINGLAHGHRPRYHYHYEIIEALGFNPDIKNVLVIGLGLGSLTEMILKIGDIQNLSLVEISPSLIINLKKMPLFQNLLSDDRLNLVIDDGRRFLFRSDEKFDFITLHPLRATTAYSNNLFCKEFFELAKKRMTSHGILLLRTTESRVLPKTVLSVFRYVRMYDHFLLASDSPFESQKDVKEQLFGKFPPHIQEVINQGGYYLGDEKYIQKLTAGYPINTKWRPVCEYYLGLRLKEQLFYKEE